MSANIPLHCLVLDGIGAAASFPAHEVLSVASASAALCGDTHDPFIGRAAIREVIRLATAKMMVGERAVVSAVGMDRFSRQSLAREAHSLGLPAIWLSRAHDTDLGTGDGVAEVIRVAEGAPLPIIVPASRGLSSILDQHAGITVVGDIHGAHQSMLAAIRWARSRRHFIILLGDILDDGVGSLEAMDEAWRLVTQGEAMVLLGNHERKIARWLDAVDGGPKVKLSDGNRVTTQALHRLSSDARRRWVTRFRGVLRRALPILDFGPIVLAHAAVHPSWWSEGARTEAVERYAVFGEPDPHAKPRFRLSYEWTNAVPADRLVLVGHDTRSTVSPFSVSNAQGGKVLFLDTGAGKGGVLSSADLRMSDGELRLANLNVH